MSAPELDRRTLMKLGFLGFAGAVLPGCGGSGGTGPVRRHLKRVDTSPDRITREIAGLRPYRPAGYRVAQEGRVVHNYGHGGCGVSLSWGTAHEAVELARGIAGTGPAAVVGCGAIGLATARLLQDAGYDVTIYTKELPPHTVSNVAAAMWAPVTLDDPAQRTPEYVARLNRACRYAFSRFQTMVGERYAIRYVEMFFIGDDPQTIPWDYIGVDDLTPLIPVPASENPFPRRYASRFRTLMIETTPYLRALLDDFLLQGGKVEIQEIGDKAGLPALAPVVLNCSGLGSRELAEDASLRPVKGQLTILEPQPEVKYGYVDGRNDLYMFPRSDGIILGGSHQEDVWTTEPDPEVAARILAEHQKISAGMR